MIKLFSLAALIGLAVVGQAKATLIYDSVNGALLANAFGGPTGDSVLGGSFQLPSAGELPYVITLGLGNYGIASGQSIMVYLAPDAGPANTPLVNGPNLAEVQQIGSVSDIDLGTSFPSVSLVSFTVPYAIAATILSESVDNEFWVVLDTGQSTSGIWYTNDGSAGIGTTGQATLISDSISSTADGAFLMTVQTPEPISIAVMGVGLAGIGAVRRRSRKA